MMEESRRVAREAWMLPEDGPLSEDQRQGVRDTVRAYMERHKLTNTHVARQVGGMKGNTLGELLNGTYGKGKALRPETIDGHLRTLNIWLDIDSNRRRTKPDARFVETAVAKRLLFCVHQANKWQTMAIAYGPTGIGKSMVAHVIAETTPGCIFMTISEGDGGVAAIRKMIAQRLRLFVKSVPRRESSGKTLNERIFDALRDTGRLLLIDEAHYLTDSALHLVRNIWDQTKSPVVLISTVDLLDRIRRDADADHGQLYRRFSHTFDLTLNSSPAGKKGGVASRPLSNLDEIRKMFTSGRVKFTPDGLQYLLEAANMMGHGSFALCRDLVRWAEDFERHLNRIPHDKCVTLHAKVLRKVEEGAKHSTRMREDMKMRRTV